MALSLANVQTSDTFSTWFTRTNEIIRDSLAATGGTVSGTIKILDHNLTVTGNNSFTKLTTANNITVNGTTTLNGITTLNNTANITKVANFSDNINVDGLSLFRANTTFLTPMTANTVSATLVEAANFNSTSDNRLKENIETIDQPNDVVSKLRGVSFNWKSDGTPAYGVIAQELQEIVPDLVSKNDNGDLTVQYMGLIAFLIESNKELLQRVEQLESK